MLQLVNETPKSVIAVKSTQPQNPVGRKSPSTEMDQGATQKKSLKRTLPQNSGQRAPPAKVPRVPPKVPDGHINWPGYFHIRVRQFFSLYVFRINLKCGTTNLNFVMIVESYRLQIQLHWVNLVATRPIRNRKETRNFGRARAKNAETVAFSSCWKTRAIQGKIWCEIWKQATIQSCSTGLMELNVL